MNSGGESCLQAASAKSSDFAELNEVVLRAEADGIFHRPNPGPLAGASGPLFKAVVGDLAIPGASRDSNTPTASDVNSQATFRRRWG